MPEVLIEGKTIRVGGRSIPLIGGEVHYWRLDPANWSPVLARVRELGLEVVASYVCWDFHEIEPGKFDFTGQTDPRRNLTGFLDLLSEQDFWVILRPGPYIYSEWRNGGVPDRAARCPRLSPEFQALARPYMEAVVQAAAPYLATRGGRIVLWQADNEIDPWPHYYTELLGLGTAPGPFQEFLRRRYGEIEALNQAWEADYTAFDQARAVSVQFPDQPGLLRRYLDFARFQHDYVTGVAAWAVSTYRELGVDVPVYLNAYSGVGTQRWADLEETGDLAGPDIYPSRELELRGPSEHRNILDAVRYTRTFSRLPHIPEFQAGIWHDWLADVGSLPPNHYRLVCLSALLAGAAGWSWYMLANRDNWYQSPINEWGRTRPELFEVFRQVVGLFHEIDAPGLEKLASTAVTYDPLQRATVRPGQDLLEALYQADIDYEFLDLDAQPGRELNGAFEKPLLLYAGGPWLSGEGQERLLAYMEAGGHLVCAGAYPYLDGSLRPLNLLGVTAPDGITSGLPPMRLAVLEFATSSPWMYNYREVPGQPITAIRLPGGPYISEENSLHAGLQDGLECTVGYTERRGRGSLTVLGLLPSAELLVGLHQHFEIPVPSRSLTPGVVTALFRGSGSLYLIAANNGNESKSASVLLEASSAAGFRHARDLVSGREWALEPDVGGTDLEIVVRLPRKDAAVVRLSAEA